MSRRAGRSSRALAVGASLVIASLAYGCVQRDVIGVTVGTVTVSPGIASLQTGEPLPFTAVVLDVEGRVLGRAQVEWSVQPPDLASIGADGVLQALNAGTATVRASFRGVTGSASITIIPAPAIAVTPNPLAIYGAAGPVSPPTATLEVTNSGGAQLRGLAVAVTYPPAGPQGWLTAVLSRTFAPATLSVTASTSALPVGVYDATLTVTSSDDPNPYVIPVSLSLTGLSVTETNGSSVVTEAGGTDSLFVVLDAQPDSAVVISVASSDTGEVTVTPGVLTFSPQNWDAPQLVILTGQNELISDGDQTSTITVSVDDALSDDRFDPVADQVVLARTLDDDTGSFTLDTGGSPLAVSESGTTDAFTVTLDSEPIADVIVRMTRGDSTEVSVAPSSLTFTPANWSAPRTVTVTGLDDALLDGLQTTVIYVAVDSAASDPAFIALGRDSLTVTTADDDLASFRIAHTPPPALADSTQVSESGTLDSLTVVLGAQPQSDVVFTITADDGGEVTVVTPSVTFIPNEWNVPHVVVLRGADDRVIDGPQVTTVRVGVNAVASDDAFDALPQRTASVTTTDDDIAALTITQSGGTTVTYEAASPPDTFRVALASQPSSNVVIGVASSDTTEVRAAPTQLAFTPVNWETPQAVIVMGVDERFDDGDRVVPVVLTVVPASSDDDFDLMPPDSVLVTNTDDDTAGLTIVQTNGGSLVTESGASDTVTVVLNARPIDPVIVTILSSDTTEVSVAPSLLTFTTNNWNIPQIVVLTGVDDPFADGNGFSLIAIGVSGGLSDASFANVPDQTVPVTTLNDDAISITVSPTTGLQTTEVGGAATFAVVLNSQPSAPVVIGLSSSAPGEGLPDQTSLTFTGGTWNAPQIVVVTGVDDLIDDGNQPYLIITAPAITSDPDYSGLDPEDVSVLNIDNDAATLSIDDVTVVEGDAGTVNAVFTVTQSVASGQTVTVDYATANGTATAGADYVANSGTLTFLPGGALTQTVTVVVNGDLLDEGTSESFTVGLSNVTNATILDATGAGTITDDDDPPTISIDDVTVLEGDAGTVNAVFTVTQSAASGLTVTVTHATANGTAISGPDFVANSGTLSFLPGSPLTQTVTVVVNGDLLDEGASESFSVNLTNATNATLSDGTGVGTITDDDDPPTFSIDDVTVVEGNAGTRNAVFTVTQSAASGLTTSVDFASADGTATAGSDYTSASGTLTFAPGGALTRTVSVVVIGDVLDEGASETFTVSLSNPTNATILSATGTGTITDDDNPPTLSINDVTLLEGNAGTVNAVFTVTQSAASGQTVTVDFGTTDGTATAGTDYVANTGTLTFLPGSPLTRTVTVVVNGDVIDEGASESFTVNLSNPTNATILDGTGVGTITDDDATALSIDDVTVVEGNAGTVSAVFTVTQSIASGQIVTVDFATADGTATAGVDYVANSGTLTFLPGGALTQTVTVVVNGDLLDEGASESFTVNLSNAVNAVVVGATGAGTITDDDGPPSLSINDVTVLEGDAGTVNAVFTVTQSATSGLAVTVNYATANGTATAGPDYVASSGALTFPAGGALTQTITVVVNGDLLDEGASESFTVNLSTPANATIADASGAGTITDDDDPPTFSIGDATVVEGNAGTRNAVFTVTQSAASGLTTSVDFATTDGTAMSGSDYTAAAGTLTFLPGNPITQTVSVVVVGDLIDEGASESFTVDLSNPTNATILNATGVGTITDDDDPPTLSINDVTVVEGNVGTVNAVFTVTQSAASGLPVTVDYTTVNGTATAPSDFVATSGTLTFLAGGALTQTVTVVVNSDLLDEGASEAYTVVLSNPTNATIADAIGDGVITDDDGSPTLSINDVTVVEGDAGTVNAVFTVTQSAQSEQIVSVQYATSDGTATAGSDYVANSGTLTFPVGPALTQTVTVVVNGDLLDEGASELFRVMLSNPSNATIADGNGDGTITDDDDPPTLTIDDVIALEGDAGTVNAVFTVTQSAPSGLAVGVSYATANGTATAGPDYVANSGTLTFLPGGALTQTVTVVVNGDLLDEGASESFTVNLTNATNATITDATGDGTITDDDGPPSLSIGDVTVVEGNAGTVNAIFAVTMSGASGLPVSVDFASADGTALAGVDYTAASGTLTFLPGGPLTQNVSVVVIADLLDEGAAESFTVALSNPSNATILGVTGTGTITDDDDPPTVSINDVTVLEGNAGTVNAVFTVTQSAASGLPVTVDYTTTDGTATAGADYVANAGTLTFLPGGPLTQTVTVLVNGDLLDEGAAESFTVDLGNATNATIADGVGVGTIIDDEGVSSLSIDDVTVVEGDAGTVNAVFTVGLSSASGQTVTVDFATADGTATAGTDYVANAGTLTFLPGGALTQTVTVLVNGDLLNEGASETFTVNLTNPVNATILRATGVGTITDDDSAPTLSIDDVTVLEGDAGTVNAVFTVTQSTSSSQTVSVDYATANGTATAGPDYVASSGTLTFLPGGALTQTVTVVVNGDLIDEGVSESYTVNLSNAVVATIADATGDGTITDDDGPPAFSIDDVTVLEGNAGTVNAVFTVTQSAASGLTTTVDFATANGTATAGVDYTAAAGTVTFLPGGALTQTISVVVVGDLIDEGVSEAFTVNLSNATSASILDATGVGTITDDDDPPTLSINDVSVVEGNAGTVNAVFTVTQSAASGLTTTVDYATADGTATAGADYVATAGTLTFLSGGPLTQTVTVVVNGDLIDEAASEAYTVNLTNPTNATIAAGTGVGTIIDDEGEPSLSIDDVTVVEGNAGTVNAVFTVTQSAQSSQTVTVDFATADGTATAASDYVASSGTVTFLPGGPLTQTVTVVVNGDLLDEGASESFTVGLTNPLNAAILDATGVGTITDDDDPPTLSIGDVSVLEGDAGTVNAVFTVTQSAASGLTVTVNYATADGTATAGPDYVANAGTLTFLPGGPLTQTVTVVVNGDLIDEGASESFTVNLSNETNATIADGVGLGTIVDNEGVPSLSIGDVTVVEGNAGTVNAAFVVTLSAASGQTVSVDYATADGTATTAGSDYVAASGTLTFLPGGAVSQTVNVVVIGDALDEGVSETFTVNLSNPANATVLDGTGTGTITDDDSAPTLSINDVTVFEGDAGTVNAVFTVTQSGASGQSVTVDFATANGTATAGADYVATSGTLTFLPGGALSQTVTVVVNGDLLDEGTSETFTVNLGNATNATIVGATGVGTIIDDEGPPSLSIDDVTVLEGDAGTVNAVFTVTQSALSGRTVTVDFATSDGTATAGPDYTGTSGTLTFLPGGALTQTITVVVIGDLRDEGAAETFTVALSNAANATILDGTGVGTITDDDTAPTLSIDDVTVLEGDAGTVNAVFTVTQSAVSGLTVRVDYATANGTATAGSDYVATTGTLTFLPGGPLTQSVTVSVIGDLRDEGASEAFTVNLSNASNATILGATGTGTITDDDDPPTFSIDDVLVVEGNAGTVNAVFTVTQSAPSGLNVTVDYATADGSATAGLDYAAASGTLTFVPGSALTQTISVVVIGDLIDEGAQETFTLNLSNATNATILDATGNGVITDDDDPPSFSINDVAVFEGNTGTVNAVFTVTQSAASGLPITVDYATANGTATAGSDYVAASGTLTFLPGGALTQTVTVVVNGDVIDEGASETFTVNLSNATNATIADAIGLGTIIDDEAPPTLTINDVTVLEGDAGTVNAVFTVTQSVASGLTVTVNYATVNGTATAGLDYVATSGTLTFLPGGALTQTITVVVNGDLLDEGASESFTVNLTNASNATIVDAMGSGTITDDDGPPTLSIDDVTLQEGDVGTSNAVFTVTQSASSGRTVTVDFATADGTATGGPDYTATSGTLTFLPGGALTQTITVVVLGDLRYEGTAETFTVNLSNVTNATFAKATGVGTITDDENAPSLSINDVTVLEGNAGTVNAVFTVTQSAISGLPVTVNYATANGTATAGADYVATSGLLTFPAGGTLTRTVTVVVNGDLLHEGTSETFSVNLSNATNATLATATGTGTITDDDGPPSFSINDVSVVEGNVGTVNAVFTVTQSAASGLTTSVDYATANGTATAGSDYAATSGTLTFLPGGQLTQTVTVAVTGDLIDEGISETFTVNLTNPTNATISTATGNGTIIDDEGPPSISTSDVVVLEGDVGTVSADFTVRLSNASSQTVTVDYTTTNGTATAGSDYVTNAGTLTFLSGGALTQIVSVVVNGDMVDEGASEAFTFNLSNASNATIADASETGTITDDDDASFSIDDVTVVEGDAGTVNAVFTVTKSLANSQVVTVGYLTADGTATAGPDYSTSSGTLTFLPGAALTAQFTVVVNGDLLDEGGSEFFTANLSNATNATISDGTGVGTIADDDGPPSLFIDNVTVLEGDAGTVNAVFTVTQSAPSGLTVSVDFATADGTATASADYTATAGTLTFLSGGALTQTVTVVVNGDLLHEGASESFTVNLSNESNATLADPTGTGTITDDDPAPTLSIDDVTVVEGNTGTVDAVFTVTQSAISGLNTTVDYATADGTANAGLDYVGNSGTATILAGGGLTQTITVSVNGDLIDEGLSESYTLNLTNPANATIVDATGAGTITDDDDATLSINDVTVLEGDAGTVNAVFTVTKSIASSQNVTVDFATANGTATAGSDYVATSGTLTFVPGGALTQTVTVVVNGDVIDENGPETYTVNLSNATNATISDAIGAGTITEDDGATLSINDVTVVEGNAGTVNAVFTVTKSLVSSQTVTVDFATADGTATAGADYVATSGTLTFLTGGSLTQTVTVTVNGDLLDEGDSEVFTVGLSNVANATIADGTGEGTITDDDNPPTLSINDVAVTEGNAGTVNAVFTVTQSAASGLSVSVDYSTSNGTATAGSDYVATSGTLTFAPGGALTQMITVVVNGDLLDESDTETFTVNLTNVTNATLADGTGVGTITDDDAAPTLSIDDVTVVEGNAGTVNAIFTVTQSAASGLTVTVDYATADGTALASSDYGAVSGTLTFLPGGALTQTITVLVTGDLVHEGISEDFTVNLTNPANATIVDPTGLGTITDDDAEPTFTITDVTVLEGNAGTVNAAFTVSLSAGNSATVTVDFATANGTATAGPDYVTNSGTLTFLSGGALFQTVTVVVNGDLIDEGASESFNVNLSNAVEATITDGTGLGTITDDDTAGVTVTPTSGLTTTEAGVTAQFTVVLNSQPTAPVTIGISSSDGTEGSVSPSSLVFSTGNWNTPQPVTVTGQNDVFADGPIAYTILTAAAVSTDSNYGGFNAADVSVTNTDNEVAGFEVDEVGDDTVTDEDGDQQTIRVRLTGRPETNVVFTITNPDATEIALSTTTLTFTTTDWNSFKSISVTGVNDSPLDDGDQITIITIAINPALSDNGFDFLAAQTVNATTIDLDPR